VNISGETGYIYLLVEHQSEIDPLMPFRLLEYSCDLMRRHIERHRTTTLPVVLPMVFYNGKKPYTGSTDLFDLFGEQAELARSNFCKPFHLIDLNKINDDELREHTWTNLLSLLMKYSRRREITDMLLSLKPVFVELWQSGSKEYIISCVNYVLYTSGADDQKTDQIVDILFDFDSQLGGEAMTCAEWLKQQGMQQGMQQGVNGYANPQINGAGRQ